jgi:hypothetical protein
MTVKPMNMHIRYLLMVVGVEIVLALGLIIVWESGWLLRSIVLGLIFFSFIFPIKLYKKKGPRGFSELKECNSEMLNDIAQFRKDDFEAEEFIKKCIELNGYMDESNFQKAKGIYLRNSEQKAKVEARKEAY